MEKREKSEDWQLIVNGADEHRHLVDYVSTPITFFLKELLYGKSIP